MKKTQKRVKAVVAAESAIEPDATETKEPADVKGNVKIELNHVVEYKGKYYRGVQEVDKALAKKLIALDEQKAAGADEDVKE